MAAPLKFVNPVTEEANRRAAAVEDESAASKFFARGENNENQTAASATQPASQPPVSQGNASNIAYMTGCKVIFPLGVATLPPPRLT